MRISIAAALISLIAACDASSPSPPHADRVAPGAFARLEVRDAWAPPTPNGIDVSAGYLTIVNGANVTDRLVSASSPRATRVEVHVMSMDGNVMQMRSVQALDIAAGQSVTLSQGGQHLMFYGVTQPFTNGENVPVKLTFEHAGDVDVMLNVRRGGAPHGH